MGKRGKAYCDEKCRNESYKVPQVTAECIQCGKPIVGRCTRLFCDKTCWRLHTRIVPPTVGNCKQCGKEFTGNAKREFCGPSCRQRSYQQKAEVPTRSCEFCGTTYESNKRWCNRDCRHRYLMKLAHGDSHVVQSRTRTKCDCHECGNEFMGWQNQRFCNSKCNLRHIRKKRTQIIGLFPDRVAAFRLFV